MKKPSGRALDNPTQLETDKQSRQVDLVYTAVDVAHGSPYIFAFKFVMLWYFPLSVSSSQADFPKLFKFLGLVVERYIEGKITSKQARVSFRLHLMPYQNLGLRRQLAKVDKMPACVIENVLTVMWMMTVC